MKKKKLIEIYKRKKKKKLIWIIKIKKDKIIIGIDLGIKEYAITYDGKCHKHYPNFNKNKDIIYLNSRLKQLSKFFKTDKDNNDIAKIEKKINKLIKKYLVNIINDIIKSKPKTIKIEDLNIKEMQEYNINNYNNHKFLNKLIDDCHWDLFRHLLVDKCIKNNIDLVLVPQYYPSSKMCSSCGSIKLLSLDDRTYICEECNLIIDRDENASINIRNYNL